MCKLIRQKLDDIIFVLRKKYQIGLMTWYYGKKMDILQRSVTDVEKDALHPETESSKPFEETILWIQEHVLM